MVAAILLPAPQAIFGMGLETGIKNKQPSCIRAELSVWFSPEVVVGTLDYSSEPFRIIPHSPPKVLKPG
jgi:hypothetical protein